jgi:hypothetical protein
MTVMLIFFTILAALTLVGSGFILDAYRRDYNEAYNTGKPEPGMPYLLHCAAVFVVSLCWFLSLLIYWLVW